MEGEPGRYMRVQIHEFAPVVFDVDDHEVERKILVSA
jgi:hypothetical protein